MESPKAKNRKTINYSAGETALRRDAVLKRMLETPPKPHKPKPVGKGDTTKKAGK